MKMANKGKGLPEIVVESLGITGKDIKSLERIMDDESISDFYLKVIPVIPPDERNVNLVISFFAEVKSLSKLTRESKYLDKSKIDAFLKEIDLRLREEYFDVCFYRQYKLKNGNIHGKFYIKEG